SLRAPLGRGAAGGVPGRPSVKEAILASKRSRGNLRAQPERAETMPTLPMVAASPAPTISGLASAPVRPRRDPAKSGNRVDKQTHDAGAFARAASPTGAYPSTRT